MAEVKTVVTTHIRLASPRDAPHILSLIQQLAEFERLSEFCVASLPQLQSTLFHQPPFQGPTVLLLEVSPDTSPSPPSDPPSTAPDFQEVARQVHLRSAINDTQSHAFQSTHCEDRTVAGFVLFFPNYSTFLAKPGLYIEDLFVRECYRGVGLGTILLKTVAQVAVKLNYGRVEWSVLDWNEKAIGFYEGIGAKLLPEWRICRLTGESLDICGS